MFGNRMLLGAVLVIVMAAALAGPSGSASVSDALSLSTGSTVVIQGACVERTLGGYIFVRDSFGPRRLLPVLAGASVARGSSLEITGRVAQVSGSLIVVALRLRVYTDSQGRAMPPIPWGMAEDWQDFADVPIGTRLMDVEYPPVPDPNTPEEEGEPESREAGSCIPDLTLFSTFQR